MRTLSIFATALLTVGCATHRESRDPFDGARPGELREVAGVRFRWCPAGRFRMGSPESETGHRPDETPVDVAIASGFWIGEFEVTQRQWQSVAGAFPDKLPTSEWGLGDDVPVYWVSFDDAERFGRKLTDRARASGELPADHECRLPTEAQWEYACRAGTTTATSFGDRFGRGQANFGGATLGGGEDGPALHRSTVVGSYPANPWGVRDMHGNVFEWCRDWYHAQLPGGSDPDLHDVKGAPNGDGTFSRVRRGGAWNDDGWACRSAFRLRYEPDRRSDHIGFRVVLVKS